MRVQIFALFISVAASTSWRYNTSSSRQAGKLNVHLVAHTHDDVGWLKTVDQYYMGLNQSIQMACVQCILDSVIPALAANPDRRFIYVEQAYFQRWWAEKTGTCRLLQKLSLLRVSLSSSTADGAVSFFTIISPKTIRSPSSQTVHDEANPDYVSMIDQTTLGHRFLTNEFGVAPKVTWQIDPFGHTLTQASLMSSAWSGFQAIYFGRADFQDISQRRAALAMETVWIASRSLGGSAATFAGINNNLYQPPDGFCYDVYCPDTPIQDDPQLNDYNVPQVVEAFVQAAYAQAESFQPYDIQMTMGSDFQYQGALSWFTRLDRLIHYVNADGRINVFYSTPSIYTTSRITSSVEWPTKNYSDFMPYIPKMHSVMNGAVMGTRNMLPPYASRRMNAHAGFYSSRIALKGYIRETMAYHQAARQLQYLSGACGDLGPTNSLFLLEQALGNAQHHDAISGTEKQHVAYDYAARLARGRFVAEVGLSAAIVNVTRSIPGTAFMACDLANASICSALENGSPTVLVLYNSLGQGVSSLPLRLPVGLPSGVSTYHIVDALGSPVTAQLYASSPSDASLRSYYGSSNGGAPIWWLAFQATVPAMGFSTYFIEPSTNSGPSSTIISPPYPQAVSTTLAAPIIISNGVISLAFDPSSGLLSSWTDSISGKVTPFTQSYLWYNSSANNADENLNSGAYTFRPNGSYPLPASGSVTITVSTQGPVLSEVWQSFDTWVTQKVRLWANATSVEFEWTVGPAPFADGLGRELVTTYTTDLATNGTWSTDSNGRDMATRVRDARPDWNYTAYEPIAGNYYPVSAAITTQDLNRGLALSVVTDRSQGGSSLADGSLELMIFRRIQQDDGWGVGEALNEPGLSAAGSGIVVRGTHRVSLGLVSAAAANRRSLMQELMFPVITRYAPLNGQSPAQWATTHVTAMSGLSAPLPANVHLLTVHGGQGKAGQQLLIRLAHLYEVDEDATLSRNATINLAKLFAEHSIISATERTLTNNQPLASVPSATYRLKGGGMITVPQLPAPPAGPDLTVTLEPMQVRTFLCDVL